MSVSSVHLTQRNGRVEERGLAAGGLKACARVERSHGVVAVQGYGREQCKAWEGKTHNSRKSQAKLRRDSSELELEELGLVQRVVRLARAGGAGRKHVKWANVRQSGRADA